MRKGSIGMAAVALAWGGACNTLPTEAEPVGQVQLAVDPDPAFCQYFEYVSCEWVPPSYADDGTLINSGYCNVGEWQWTICEHEPPDCGASHLSKTCPQTGVEAECVPVNTTAGCLSEVVVLDPIDDPIELDP